MSYFEQNVIIELQCLYTTISMQYIFNEQSFIIPFLYQDKME